MNGSPMYWVGLTAALAACARAGPLDPYGAPPASVDRFSAAAGTLFVRDGSTNLPGPNEPIDFDVAPFATLGLSPAGQTVVYYNFDAQGTTPAPIYVLFRVGESIPVPDQGNIVDAIPGDPGYNDFWQVVRVTVPADYRANTVTSLEGIEAEGFARERTPTLVNCPIVPEGSTAARRLGGGAHTLNRGWYRNQSVYYFTFDEKALSLTGGAVPVSTIYVTFNVNPDLAGGGPPSGFRTEPASAQTHNVVDALPSDAAYAPLWSMNVYDNTSFASVTNLATAQAAPLKGVGVMLVNGPVVSLP